MCRNEGMTHARSCTCFSVPTVPTTLTIHHLQLTRLEYFRGHHENISSSLLCLMAHHLTWCLGCLSALVHSKNQTDSLKLVDSVDSEDQQDGEVQELRWDGVAALEHTDHGEEHEEECRQHRTKNFACLGSGTFDSLPKSAARPQVPEMGKIMGCHLRNENCRADALQEAWFWKMK